MIISQIQQDVLNIKKITLGFKEYALIAALFLYINNQNIDQIGKYIPSAIVKSTKKEIWNQQIKEFN